ncbi:MAG: MAPEG family protein [Myxococcales bacterium]|nr:MAPEG family protein [Myxococcales bacterium]
MTVELWMLATQGVLALVLALATGLGTATVPGGVRWGLSNREEVFRHPGWVGRAQRSHRNQLENLPVFAALVICLHLAGRHSVGTELGAMAFAVSRGVFTGLYLAGVTRWRLRTLTYFFSVGALTLTAGAGWIA